MQRKHNFMGLKNRSLNLFLFRCDVTEGFVGQRPQRRSFSLYRQPRLSSFATLDTKFRGVMVLVILQWAEITGLNVVVSGHVSCREHQTNNRSMAYFATVCEMKWINDNAQFPAAGRRPSLSVFNLAREAISQSQLRISARPRFFGPNEPINTKNFVTWPTSVDTVKRNKSLH